MFISPRKGAIAGIVAVLILAACSSNNSGASQTASAMASESTMASESAAPSAVATVPSDQLAFPGKLLVCIDIPYPPQEFFDSNGNPTGADPDIAAAIAQRLGLTLQVENSVFDTIIAAVTSGKCDIIISAQNITDDRVKQVDMVPYFKAGQSFVVAKGNPAGIQTTDDLCGKAIAAESGTTEVDYVKTKLNPDCSSKSKAAIDLKEFQKDSDALAALTSGNVDAYFADSPVAGYYTVQHPDQFELAPIKPLDPAPEGISVPQEKTQLRDAIVTVLKSMIDDGTYLDILKKYGIQDGAITSADVVPATSK
jgi:polar amino acid transport system substrate-binding protein